jgi:hypothetical protein
MIVALHLSLTFQLPRRSTTWEDNKKPQHTDIGANVGMTIAVRVRDVDLVQVSDKLASIC